MDQQQIANALFVVASGVGGYFIKVLWDAIKDLQTADRNIAEKISSIEVLVAGKYVTRDELANQMSRIVDQLNRIEERLQFKADR